MALFLGRVIIAEPDFEQVAQDVKSTSLGGPCLQKLEQRLRYLRSPRIEVAIGDEQVFFAHAFASNRWVWTIDD